VIQIPFLKTGDTIAIAATARKISAEEIEPAIKIFESWGLKVKCSSSLFETNNQFAGDDMQRAKGFQELLDNPEVKAIICARGGYGTVRIIDMLDWRAFGINPKWIVGYSDITVLHNHLHTKLGIPSIHGTMPINMLPDKAHKESIESLQRILFGEKPESISTLPHPSNKKGTAKATLIGGNLSVIYSLLGSASDIDTRGKILFLEDLDEYLYHIDRMMMNLKRNGKLHQLAGLVVGGMSDMKDNTVPFGSTAEEIIASHLADADYPFCFAFPAGHEKRNLPIILGGHYHLSVNESGATLALNY
jgi:muramoyltetrapeptide carboxypeptidase